MNAHEFVADFGIEKAKEVLEGAPDWACYYSTIDGEYYLIELDAVNLRKLKQVVESVEVINQMFGMEQAKQTRIIAKEIGYSNDYTTLKKAIEDCELVESYKENQHV